MESTHPVVDIGSDVEGIAQVEASRKDTTGGLFLPDSNTSAIWRCHTAGEMLTPFQARQWEYTTC